MSQNVFFGALAKNISIVKKIEKCHENQRKNFTRSILRCSSGNFFSTFDYQEFTQSEIKIKSIQLFRINLNCILE